MTQFYKPFAFALAVSGLLAGCGGGGGENQGNTPMVDAETDDTDGSDVAIIKDAGRLLSEGHSLPVNAVGLREDVEEGTTTFRNNVNFNITRNERGEYIVVLQGHKHTFTSDQMNEHGGSYKEQIDSNVDPDIWFTTHSVDVADLNSGHSNGDHFMAFKFGRELYEIEGADPEIEGFAIVGNPTINFNTEATRDVTATYLGSALMDTWPSAFPKGESIALPKYRYTSSNVTLTANFNTSTISGQIANWTAEDAGPLSGIVLTIPSMRFDNRGFTGDFSVSGLNTGTTGNLSYDGSFYGPNADNAAATISGTFNEGDNALTYALGWFGTRKQD